MSHDFIQNAVNALYQSNELMALKGELANLKAERDQLKADLEKSDGVVWTLSVENARLKAEVERLIEAWVDKKMQEDRDALLEQVERLTKAGDVYSDVMDRLAMFANEDARLMARTASLAFKDALKAKGVQS
jgi:predicted RNase H-like nuclease (RuvC/YqgF family)